MWMGAIVIGLFVLVWVISAVAKNASAPPPPVQNRNRSNPNPRPAPTSSGRPVERTTSSDLSRFQEEIDRLQRRGSGVPTSRPASPPPVPRTRPEPERRPAASQPRTRAVQRTSAPPPVPLAAPPVLRPLLEPLPTLLAITPVQATPIIPKSNAKSVLIEKKVMVSPLLTTIRSMMASKQSAGVAVVLAEVFSEPRGRKAFSKTY